MTALGSNSQSQHRLALSLGTLCNPGVVCDSICSDRECFFGQSTCGVWSVFDLLILSEPFVSELALVDLSVE